jgi:hypothetical protein
VALCLALTVVLSVPGTDFEAMASAVRRSFSEDESLAGIVSTLG